MIKSMKRKEHRGRSSIPLYSRIESLIRNKILNGQLEPGEKLPNEEELVHKCGASRITIRTALSHLEDEGLIRRNRAKGTFVSEHVPKNIEKFLITNDIDNVLVQEGSYQMENIDIKTVKASETRNPHKLKSFFNITNASPISVVRRTGLLHGEVLYFLENFLPPEIAAPLTPQELYEKPLLRTLMEKTDIVVGYGEMSIEAIPAEPDIANILNIQIFDPLILRQLCYYFPSGEPFEIVFCFMKPDYFRYKVEIKGADLPSRIGATLGRSPRENGHIKAGTEQAGKEKP